MKRLFLSSHKRNFRPLGFGLLSVIALGFGSYDFPNSQDFKSLHGAKAGSEVSPSGGTVQTIPDENEHEHQTGGAPLGRPVASIVAALGKPGARKARQQARLEVLDSLPLTRQKQKEAGRCLTPDWPLLVSLEQIMKNKTNTYSGGAL